MQEDVIHPALVVEAGVLPLLLLQHPIVHLDTRQRGACEPGGTKAQAPRSPCAQHLRAPRELWAEARRVSAARDDVRKLNEGLVLPPRLWRDHADADARRFYAGAAVTERTRAFTALIDQGQSKL